MGRITITSRSAPQLGRTRADFTDDWTVPATYYDLSGPRITGSVTVLAAAHLKADAAPQLEDCDIRILLGRIMSNKRDLDYVRGQDLEQRLTVNGVEIARGGPSTRFDPVGLADPEHFRGGHLSWHLPDRSRETAQALLRCTALHWARRDPHFLVFRINAVQGALRSWQYERRQRMAGSYRDVLEKLHVLEALRAVGDGAHRYGLAPPPGPVPEPTGAESPPADARP